MSDKNLKHLEMIKDTNDKSDSLSEEEEGERVLLSEEGEEGREIR